MLAVWLVAPLLLGGGLSVLAVADTPAGGERLQGEVGFAAARALGTLAVEAAEGALLVEGVPWSFALDVQDATLTVVSVVKLNAANPLGGPVGWQLSHRRDATSYPSASLTLLEPGPAPRAYAFRDGGVGGFSLALGRVSGEPFWPGPSPQVAVGTPDMASSFEHAASSPAFRIATAGGDGSLRAAMRDVRASGPLTLVLDHWDFALDHDGGRDAYATGIDRDVTGPTYRQEERYAILEARSAELRADLAGSDASFGSARPTYALDGALAIPAGSGRLDYGGAASSFAGQPVVLEGTFRIAPRADAREASPLSEGSAAPPVRASVAGDARTVRVAGQAWDPGPVPEALRTASLAAVVLGALGMAWGALTKSLAPVLLPLYARLSGREVLSHRHRLALYRIVEQRGMVHLRELQRTAGLGFGTTAYHLEVLRRERAVASVRIVGREFFFIPARGRGAGLDARALALLAHPTRRAIADALAASGGATQGELAARLGLDQGLLSRHLAKLQGAGLVEAQGARNKRYTATPRLAAWVHPPAARAPHAPSALAAAGMLVR